MLPAPTILTAAGSLVLAGPVVAQDCRLALLLALDVSSAVNAREDRLQREGLAQALLAPKVVEAFSVAEPIVLHVFEWSGEQNQTEVLPVWQLIEDKRDLTRVSVAIAYSPRLFIPNPPNSLTAVGAALLHAAEALRRAPDCQAWAVDVSGDGWSNEGIEPDEVYASHAFEAVAVNGLVVTGPHLEDQMVAWFRDTLLHGPGAFMVLADGYADYERTMTAKPLRELAQPLVSGWPSGRDAG